MRHLPGEILKHPDNDFKTPSEAVKAYDAVDSIDVPHTISWADIERDLSAWRGNPMQENALTELYHLKDKVEQLIAAARRECAGTSRAPAVEKELGYFVRKVDRMQDGTFRSKGFFIGSGVIEAGGKTIIGARCKQSGMHWGEPGAQNILALRCIHASRRLDQFWKERLNARAARNDCLALAE